MVALLLRTLAIAALVFALARPVESSELVPEMGAENVAFVIDVSGSMAHMLPGEDSLFERARGAVEDRVERLYPGQLSTLIWAAVMQKPAWRYQVQIAISFFAPWVRANWKERAGLSRRDCARLPSI